MTGKRDAPDSLRAPSRPRRRHHAPWSAASRKRGWRGDDRKRRSSSADPSGVRARRRSWARATRPCRSGRAPAGRPRVLAQFRPAFHRSPLCGRGSLRHAPLGAALREYADASAKVDVLKLLEPVSRASEACDGLKEIVESGEIFHPLRWTPADAMRLLQDVARPSSRLKPWLNSTNSPNSLKPSSRRVPSSMR